jgi:hypothetical protein
MHAVKCPGCSGTRAPRQYLCRACWRTLPTTTRSRLMRRDPHAMIRLRQLHDALAARTPLAVIRVSR